MPARRKHASSPPAKQLTTRKRMAASPSIAKLPKATPSPKIRPLKDRVAEIALDALHSSSDRGRPVKKREIDDLWGNS